MCRDSFPFSFYSHLPKSLHMCSFLLMAPRGPIPWTETIWIHSGNLFQAPPLNQLRLQNPGNQISSQPIQKRWRLPGTPMSRLASNQTVSSETQIPLTDHQGLIQSSAFTWRHQSVLFAKAAQCPSWVLVTEGLRKHLKPRIMSVTPVQTSSHPMPALVPTALFLPLLPVV